MKKNFRGNYSKRAISLEGGYNCNEFYVLIGSKKL